MLCLNYYKATCRLNRSKDKQADEKWQSMHQSASRSSAQRKGHVTTVPPVQTNLNSVCGTLVAQEVAKAQGKQTSIVKFTKQKIYIASIFNATFDSCVLRAMGVKCIALVNQLSSLVSVKSPCVQQKKEKQQIPEWQWL